MASLLYTISFTPAIGNYGTLIEYKAVGDVDWTTPSSPVNPTSLTSYPLTLQTGVNYVIRLSSNGIACSRKYVFLAVPVGACCPDGYTISPDGTYCSIEATEPPSIVQSNICLAPSQLAGQYSSTGTFLMNAGYDVNLNGSYTALTTTYWKEAPASVSGPMNREAVWVDTDCNGTKDALTAGQTLQITFPYYTAVAKTVYIGIGGDNTFKVNVNGVDVACAGINSVPIGGTPTCPTAGGFGASVSANFNIFWLFPVALQSGTNYITISGVGDGSTNDALGAVIYDNTAAELAAATSDGDLNILMQTSTYIGEHIDIATCNVDGGFFLDTSGGQGNYICRRVTITTPVDCGGPPPTPPASVINIYGKAQGTVFPPVAQVLYSKNGGATWLTTMITTVSTSNTFMVSISPTAGDDLYFAVVDNSDANIVFGVGNGGGFTGFCGESSPYHYGVFSGNDNLYFNLQVVASNYTSC